MYMHIINEARLGVVSETSNLIPVCSSTDNSQSARIQGCHILGAHFGDTRTHQSVPPICAPCAPQKIGHILGAQRAHGSHFGGQKGPTGHS